MLFSALSDVSEELARTSKRSLKHQLLVACLRAAEPDARALVALYLSGAVRQSKLGVGGAQLRAIDAPAAPTPSLTVAEVDHVLGELAGTRGAGSSARRARLLETTFARATLGEQRFLARLIMGELRQGALESLVLEAVAEAAGVPAQLMRRARMLAGELAPVTSLAFERGAAGLHELDVQLFRPLSPMLAEPAEDVRTALAQLETAALEHKLDGARVQLHKRGDEVRVYTRSLNDVTDALPELTELARELPAHELILDGEVIALYPNGRPYPFQETMRRFGRKLDVAALRVQLPLSSFFFDCLYVDGESLLDLPAKERIERLGRVVPERARVPRIITSDAEEAERFLRATLALGHEGIMAKDLSAPYAAGSRGASWLKIKEAHTLDLVVLAAEWGSGRRTGTLSNLHLGARNAEGDGFVMLGKTFKGLTDELLAFQTAELLARETHRDELAVHVRPELVVEVAFSDVQASPRYPGGLALRFARVKGYRPDKTASEADSIDTVRSIFARATGQGG